MSDDTNNQTANETPNQNAQQALDDLTVLSDVGNQDMGQTRLNMVRGTDVSEGALGTLATIHQGSGSGVATQQGFGLQTGGIPTEAVTIETADVAIDPLAGTSATSSSTSESTAAFDSAVRLEAQTDLYGGNILFGSATTTETTPEGDQAAPAEDAASVVAPAEMVVPPVAPEEVHIDLLPVFSGVTLSGGNGSDPNPGGPYAMAGEEGEDLRFRVNAYDPDGGTVSIDFSAGEFGTVAYDPATGEYVYHPSDENWWGQDRVTVFVRDDEGNVVSREITIDLSNVDDETVVTLTGGVGDESTTTDATVVTGTIHATDIDGAIVGYEVIGGGQHGTLTVDANGTFVFTAPDYNWNGSDSFTVRITDELGGTTDITVPITVNATDDRAEITSPDHVELRVGQDGTAHGDLDATDPDGDTLTYGIIDPATGNLVPTLETEFGTVAIDPATGEYTFTPNDHAKTLDDGDQATQTFQVAVTDGHTISTPQTVDVLIDGANDAPVVGSFDGSLSASEDGTASGTVSGTDVDANDTVTYTLVAPDGSHVPSLTTEYGTVVINPTTGEYTFTPKDGLQALDDGESVTDGFRVAAFDGTAYSEPKDVGVTITGSNDAPVVSVSDLATGEDAPVSGTATFTDVDVEASSFYLLDAEGNRVTSVQTEYGSVSIDTATGQYTFTPGDAADALKAGEVSHDGFRVVAFDGTAESAPKTVDVTITGSNDAPVVSVSDLATGEDAPVSGTATFTDVDDSSTSFYLLDAEGNRVTSVQTEYGSVSIDTATGQYTFTPGDAADRLNVGDMAHDSFRVVAFDGMEQSAPKAVDVAIAGSDDATVVTGSVDLGSMQEDSGAITFTQAQLLGNASDVDNTLHVANVNVDGGRLVDNGNGTWTFTPSADFSGAIHVSYDVVTDDGVATRTSAELDVTAVADQPDLAVSATVSGASGSITVDVNAAVGAGTVHYETSGSTTIGDGSSSLVMRVAQLTGGNKHQAASFDVAVVNADGTTTVIGHGQASGSAWQNVTIDLDDGFGGFQAGQTLKLIGERGTNVSIDKLVVNGVEIQAETGTKERGANFHSGSGSDGGYASLHNGAVSFGLRSDQAEMTPVSETHPLTITVSGQESALGGVTLGGLPADSTVTYQDAAGQTVTLTVGDDGTLQLDAAAALRIEAVGAVLTTEPGVPVGAVTTTFDMVGTGDADELYGGGGDNHIVGGSGDDVIHGDATVEQATVALDIAGSSPDTSETLTYTISGVPAGLTLANSAGPLEPNDDGSYTLSADELHELHVSVPAGSPLAVFDLTVTATSHDGDDTASVTRSLHVDATVADGGATGNDTLDGGAGNDTLYGGGGNDVLDGGAGADTIYAGTGDDTIVAKAGEMAGDAYHGGDGSDTLVIALEPGEYTTAVREELLQFQTFIAEHPGETFTFATLGGATADSIEALTVMVGGQEISLETPPEVSAVLGGVGAESTTDAASVVTGRIVAGDADGDTLTYTVLDNGAAGHNGTLAVNADGTFTFTAKDENWNGNDSFTVRVSDGFGGFVDQQVSVTVSPTNDAPTVSIVTGAEGAESTTAEDTQVSGRIVATDVDGDTLTYTVLDNGAAGHNGTLAVNADGTFTFTAKDENWNGSDSFTVRVADGQGGFVDQQVSVTVTPTNDAPVVSIVTGGTGVGTAQVTGQVVATDVDGDSLSFSVVDDGAAHHGTLTVDADGNYVFTADQSGWTGSDSFTVQVSDGHGGVVEQTIDIRVDQGNSAPVAVDDSRIDAVAQAPSLSVSISDAAVTRTGGAIATPDDWAGLSTMGDLSGTNLGNVYGTIGGTADSDAYIATSYGTGAQLGSGDDSLWLKDGTNGAVQMGEGSDVLRVDGTAQAVSLGTGDDRLEVRGSANGVIDAGDGNDQVKLFNNVNASLSLGAGDDKLDVGGHVNGSGPIDAGIGDDKVRIAGNVGAKVDLGSGNDYIAIGGDLSSTLVAGDGDDMVKIGGNINGKVDLGDGNDYLASTGYLNGSTISAGAGNDTVVFGKAGQWSGGGTIDMGEGDDTLTFKGHVQSTLMGGVGQDTLVLSDYTAASFANEGVAGKISGFEKIVLGDGTVIGDASVVSGGTSTYSYTVTVDAGLNDTDGSEALSAATLANIPADATVMLGDQVLSRNADGTFTVALDGAGDATLTVSASHALDLSGIATTVAAAEANGGATATVTVTGAAATAGQTDVDESIAVAEDHSLTLQSSQLLANDTDVDGDILSITGVGNATHGTVSLDADGNVVFTPDANYTGTATFEYTVSDGKGGTDTATVTVQVTNENDAPVVSLVTGGTGAESTTSAATTVSGQIAASDADGDTLTYSVVDDGQSHNGTLSIDADGNFTFTAKDASWDGTETFTVRVSDGQGGVVETPVTITVTPVADTPVVSISTGLAQQTVINVTDLGGSAGYDNTYGYYVMDDQGNPTTGQILFANTHDSVNQTVTIEGVDPSRIGYFVVPDGDDRNCGLDNGDSVSFTRDSQGRWQVVDADGDVLSGEGMKVIFSNAALNSDGLTHMVDNATGGNQNWEDLAGGGDRDFNDVNIQVTETTTSAGSATTMDDHDANGSSASSSVTAGLFGGKTYGGAGNDTVSGSLFDDTLYGGSGNDTIRASSGDTAFGGSGNDVITANQADLNFGGATLVGNSGSDTLTGSCASDVMYGDDVGGGGTAAGGYAYAALNISGTASESAETLSYVVGALPAGVTLVDADGNALPANADGSYSLNASQLAGLELKIPTDGSVTALDLAVTAISHEGMTTASASSSTHLDLSELVSDGADTMYGGSGNDDMYGGGGNDLLYGGSGSDYLGGDAGNDVLNGGAGADTLVGGAGIDTADFSDSGSGVNVYLGAGDGHGYGGAGGYGVGGDAQGDTYSGIENVVGSAHNDYVYGAAGGSVVDLGAGNDTFDNSEAANAVASDTVDGGAGNDTIWTGNGNDVLLGGSGDDVLNGEAGDDTLSGGTGNDVLNGGDGSDTFLFDFGAGHDTMNGGGGSDWLDLTGLDAGTTFRVEYADGSSWTATTDGTEHAANLSDDQGKVVIQHSDGSTDQVDFHSLEQIKW